MKEVLKYYRDRLINTSQRNKSVFLPKTYTGYFFDLHRVDFLDNRSSFDVVSQLIAGQKVTLSRVSDSRSEENNLVAGELKKLFRSAQFTLEESGAKNLFVGWPYVRAITNKGTLVRAPLLLISVEMKIENSKWVIFCDAPISFNKSLLYAISRDEGLPLEQSFIEQDFSSYSSDSIEFRTQLYNSIKEIIIDIDFGTDTFRDVLIPFVSFGKEDFKHNHKIGRYKIFNEAILGIFSTTDGYLMPDYDEIIKDANRINKFEELLTKNTDASDFNILTPFPCDSWQEEALSKVLSGKSLVVQGPPGSGKSQLISNLILNLISKNKKVLVVSQKRSALEVIYKRFCENGFDKAVCFVHDFKKDQKKIYSELLSSIEKQDYITQLSTTPNGADLEFAASWEEIYSIQSELEAFRNALFDESRFGVCAHDLYHKINQNVPTVALGASKEYLHLSVKIELEKKLKIIYLYRQKFEKSGHFFSNRVSFSAFSRSELNIFKEQLQKIDTLKAKQDEFYQRMIPNDLNYQITLSEVDFIISQKEKLIEIASIISEKDVFELFRGILEFKFDYEKFIEEYHLFIKFLSHPNLEYSSLEEVLELQSKLIDAIEKQRNFFTGLTWSFLSKDKLFINRFIVKENLNKQKRPLHTLLTYIDNRLNFEHLRRGMANSPWAYGFPDGFDKTFYQQWFEKVNKANRAKELFLSLKHLTSLFEMKGADCELIVRKLDRIYILAEEIKLFYDKLNNFLTLEQIDSLLGQPELKSVCLQALEDDFDDLVYFDKFLESLPAWQKELFDACFQLETNDFEELRFVLEQNIFAYFLKVLESESPELALVSTQKFEVLQDILQSNIAKNIQLSHKIVKRSIEKAVRFPTQQKQELMFQLQKKRNLLPIRQLIEQYASGVMDMLPCWMASPDAVSAIFPLDFCFDVVIFDEASQCFAEKGIPCFFRAKQVVICGDPKQLQPSNFYQGIADENSNQAVSILEFSQRYFEQVMLKGHYRCENPLMIEFSNRFFYNEQLRFLEHYKEFVSGNRPITYVKVEGKWENQSNVVEAYKAIGLVKELYAQGEYSIGVVSFNFVQQQLIEDLAEELPESPEKLLIRNIENIQGDERDFIILSIGYTKNEQGKLRNYFGALNQPGGENRLNVAVTRARKHIYVVTGLDYGDFDFETTKSEGVKLLQEYLKFAQLGVQKGGTEFDLQPTESLIWQTLDCPKQYRSGLGTVTGKGLLASDDACYLRFADVKDVFGYLPIELSRKGWPYKRFFARERWVSEQKFEFEVKKFS